MEKDCLANIKKSNFIWYYDPLTNHLEWIGLTELVNNIVTEQFDNLVDPVQIICGCSLIAHDAKLMIKDSSFYQKKLEISVLSRKQGQMNHMTTNTSKFKFFQEKGETIKNSFKRKVRQTSKAKKKMSKSTAKKKKSKQKPSNRISKPSKRHKSVDRNSIPNLISSKINIRAKSYRLKKKSKSNKIMKSLSLRISV